MNRLRMGAIIIVIVSFGLAYYCHRVSHDATGLVFGVMGLLLLAFITRRAR